MSKIYSESVFIDSGAYTLYHSRVLKKGPALTGKHGRELERPVVRWGEGDFSFYDLRPGTEFRKYCDSYAGLMKKVLPYGVMCANVDVISHAELTWEVQQYFEQEHGVIPIPVVHYGTSMKWIDHYMSRGHTLIAVSGLGHQYRREEYMNWADILFCHVCPESNGYKPTVRIHGFAMTSWKLLRRYPWWSVDSASWIKVAAYGCIYVPRWSHEREDWRWDKEPLSIAVSAQSSADAQASGKHYDYAKVAPALRETVDHWLAYIGLELGSVDADGKVKVYGVASHHRARATANLRYLKELEQSRPKWPYPLDRQIIEQMAVKYRKGFGL